ncbi:MAG: extracellular solute-binding protein [Spirochaetota bacterium]|jgi:putative aldouronate transport system substrate-binding protein|nr:extracellular solute-binding protein [Treponema sp.]
MKKALLVFLGLLTAALLMAAGNADTGQTGGTKIADLADGRFTQTKTITVEVYDRGTGTPPEDNFFARFIKEGMLRDHNVNVVFKPVPRWTEVQALNNLLAAGEAPDICVTYDYPTIQTYANMGGVMDLNPYLEQFKPYLKNLWDLLGDNNIYYDQDPKTKQLWAIEGIRKPNTRTTTFIREDWLKKLNLPEPKTLAEFEKTLKAFRDNAEKLLGKDKDKMIPFFLTVDVGWYINNLADSFVPDKTSDEQLYIYGFDDRHLLWPKYKEAVRVVNKWYNEGLIWKDFALYPVGDQTGDNLIKSGYVGAFIQNWDYPYRDGEKGIHGNLQKLIGPEAAFIAIDTFKNDAGKYRKYLGPAVDRKVFFPATNKEPLASLLYLNWISKLDNRKFLAIGEPGVHHDVLPDGAVKMKPVEGDKRINSLYNIDYTITLNGLDLGDPALNARSLALGYGGVDPRYIEKAYKTQTVDVRIIPAFKVGEIKAEQGMGPALSEKRNTLLVKAVVAKTSDFDKVFDAGMQDYLRSGGQAIIDERKAKIDELKKSK